MSVQSTTTQQIILFRSLGYHQEVMARKKKLCNEYVILFKWVQLTKKWRNISLIKFQEKTAIM